MERLLRQKYTKEFCEQAIRLIIEQELMIPEVARRLAMSNKDPCEPDVSARHGHLGEPSRPSPIPRPRWLGSSANSLRPEWSATS